MNRIPDEKITAISKEYLANGMVKSKALQTVGYTKNYAEHGGLKLFDNVRVKAAIEQATSDLSRKNEISLVHEQLALERIADKSEAIGNYPAAISARATLLKTIPGAFKGEKQDNTQIMCKAFDAHKLEQARIAAQLYLEAGHGRMIESEVVNVQRQGETAGIPATIGSTETAAGFDKGLTNSGFDRQDSTNQANNPAPVLQFNDDRIYPS
jgi:hypothetical protein